MGITLGDLRNNTIVLQFQVADVKHFFNYLEENGGSIIFGPSYDQKDNFSPINYDKMNDIRAISSRR
jgi:hypothetical protein